MLNILKDLVNFFIIDPVRKILALIFACGLWLFVAIDSHYNYEKEIKINYTGLPNFYILVDSVARIKTTFYGKGKVLFGIWLSEPVALCDLSGAVIGKNVIFTKDFVIPVKDVTIDYETKFINVEIDKKIRKPVKPLIHLKGVLKEGFSLSGIELKDTVFAIGPQKLLHRIKEVKTESLDLRNHSETFEKSLMIEPLPAPIKLSSDYITAQVFIDTSDQKIFTRLPIQVAKNPKQNVRMGNPFIDTLIIAGARSLINKLDKERLIVRIKITDLVPGEYHLSPEVILPEFLSVVHITPQRLRVLVY